MEDITPADSVVPVYLVPLTPEEELEQEKTALEAEERETEEKTSIDAKQSALEKLALMGLTEKEAKAVIGL